MSLIQSTGGTVWRILCIYVLQVASNDGLLMCNMYVCKYL